MESSGSRWSRHSRCIQQIFGVTIHDEAAEFTFRLFDHPQVYIFKRTAPRG
jgi:hypothetical protein